jgi:hypothetical protein
MIRSVSRETSRSEIRVMVRMLLFAVVVAGIIAALAAVQRGSGLPLLIAVGLAEVTLLATAFLEGSRSRRDNWLVTAVAVLMMLGTGAIVLVLA